MSAFRFPGVVVDGAGVDGVVLELVLVALGSAKSEGTSGGRPGFAGSILDLDLSLGAAPLPLGPCGGCGGAGGAGGAGGLGG